MQNFYDYSLTDFKSLTSLHGYKDVHAENFYTSKYKGSEKHIPENFIQYLKTNFNLALPKIQKIQTAEDELTVKFLVELSDGNCVETVLVPFNKKYTICISSQVGCAMKCSFCFTGTQGLKRNLEVHEIVGQYVLAYNYIKENFPEKFAAPNIVFMGQGEPLHNFDNIKRAISIFLEVRGLHLGPRQITLSTAGYLPGLKKIEELNQVNIALSFHSPFNNQRDELIPLNKAYPIEEIVSTLKDIPRLKRQYLTFEYLIIKDMNHSEEHVQEIVKLLSGLPVIFNLIPFNEFPGAKYKRPLDKDVDNFKQRLVDHGFFASVRKTKGDDILAACGQLNTKS
ncbi:23S rRNA (adenine(2503)-C(2))-methyltransferase RlmN [Bacteriovorax sp. Seq25_V]|uniref:23S rRNA (adenine(2503)-C(2))-methyltransferase RlmN n=1 Tax=Bacteriovorax sp. Seq25_V TaxID=1201288 RepID=UPI00038A3A52|nr:23S rRNA (adenine(2503)-C(2))-methyltransferase RlmN [Bacteriovorax sp. Seq25_V]EQC45415.1 23S rRNA m2A2503 methyltransferase [Bacteriovorax sp. Seq25_V]